MQQLKFQLLLKLQKVNAGGESDGWKAWIEKLLDPATFEKGQHLLLGEAGLMDERLSSAGKLAFAFVLGTHDRMLLSAIQSGQKETLFRFCFQRQTCKGNFVLNFSCRQTRRATSSWSL